MHRKLAESLRSIWRQMSHESIAGKDPTSSLSKLPGLFHSSFSQTGEEKLASLMCIYICFFLYGIWFGSLLLFEFFYSVEIVVPTDCNSSTSTAQLLLRRKLIVSAGLPDFWGTTWKPQAKNFFSEVGRRKTKQLSWMPLVS